MRLLAHVVTHVDAVGVLEREGGDGLDVVQVVLHLREHHLVVAVLQQVLEEDEAPGYGHGQGYGQGQG